MSDEYRLALSVSSDVSSADVSCCESTYVETDVVAWLGLVDHCVVHLYALDLSRLLAGVEDDCLSSVENTSLDLSYWDGSDTADFVNVLNWQA